MLTDPLKKIVLLNESLNLMFTGVLTGHEAAKMGVEVHSKLKRISEENQTWGRVDVDRELKLVKDRLIRFFQSSEEFNS